MRPLLMPVFDVILIITLAWLGVGHLLPIAGAPDPALKQQADEATRAVADHQRVQEELQKARQAIARAKQELDGIVQTLVSLSQEIIQLKQQLAAATHWDKERTALAAALKERETEAQRLEKEREAQQRKLAAVQAALATAGKDTYSLKSGAPLVRAKTANHRYGVMLSEGKVIPVASPYYTGRRRADGTVVVWPERAGLTIDEALKPTSLVMREVTTEEFRRDGRVTFLVNADSFATFRALRDELVRRGIDYGWEPVTGTKFGMSATGKDIPSQGGTP
jgi:predicted RNase H-like nuclease (RuvC/YqgF family)